MLHQRTIAYVGVGGGVDVDVSVGALVDKHVH